MRGSVTAWLRDGVYAGAFVQVEAIDGTPPPSIYFAALEGRVEPMPRDNVSAEVLNEAGGRWRLYGRDADEPVEDVWPYRLLTAAAAQDHREASRIRPRRYVRRVRPDGVPTRVLLPPPAPEAPALRGARGGVNRLPGERAGCHGEAP